MEQRAFRAVSFELFEAVVVREAEFADVDHVGFGEGLRVGAEIPGLHLMFAHLDALQIAYAGDFGLILRHAAAGPEFFDLFLARVGALFCGGSAGFGGSGGILEVSDVEVTVIGLGGARCDFRSNDRDRLIAAGAVVLLTANQRRAGRLGLGITGGGG